MHSVFLFLQLQLCYLSSGRFNCTEGVHSWYWIVVTTARQICGTRKLWWKLLQISAACCTYFMHQSFVCVWMCMPHCCMRINDCSVHFLLLFCGGFVLWVLNWKGRNQQSCVVWAAGAACTFMFLYKSFWIQLKYWASSQSCDQIGIQPLFLSSRGLSTLLDMTC